MKNRYARARNSEAKIDVSSRGQFFREYEVGGEKGQIARLRIGEGATALVLTLEQQPGHEPIAFVQNVRFNSGLSHDVKYRPTGQPLFLDLEAAKQKVIDAYFDQVEPVNETFLAIAMNFVPTQTNNSL